MQRKGKTRIGISGWSCRYWKGPFCPGDIADSRMLPFYFQQLGTVEINSSFYHLPLRKTFENWLALSPDGFVFVAKASRFITHVKKLKDFVEAVERFFERVSGMVSP